MYADEKKQSKDQERELSKSPQLGIKRSEESKAEILESTKKQVEEEEREVPFDSLPLTAWSFLPSTVHRAWQTRTRLVGRLRWLGKGAIFTRVRSISTPYSHLDTGRFFRQRKKNQIAQCHGQIQSL